MGTVEQEQSLRLRGSSSPDWWPTRAAPPVPGGYEQMVESVRELLDALAAAVPGEDLVADVTAELCRLTGRLGAVATDEYHQLSGTLDGVPGRGQVMTPPARIVALDESSVEATVRFTRHYLGGNGAVHGGAVPLLFDDILGRFAQTSGRPLSRTAYLRVDYRSITPVDRQLRLAGRLVSEQGRKKLVRATLHDGDVLCAEAEALFVVLRPGQR